MLFLKAIALSALIIYLCRTWYRRQGLSLPFPWIGLAFLFRYLMGMAYGYIFLHYYGGDDTWVYNQESHAEYLKLLKDPLLFINDLSPARLFTAQHLLPTVASYLNDLEFWMITKPLALVHFYTDGNYYLNVLFFNGVSFWGCLLLYRSLREVPRDQRLIFFWLFLFPPLIFWWSGIRSDGLIFLFTALFLNGFQSRLQQKQARSLLKIAIGLAGILILRSPLLLLWIPVVICWLIHHHHTKYVSRTIALVYVLSALIFFASALIDSEHNLPNAVAHRQQAFFALPGKTRFQLDSLNSSPYQFLKVAPQAMENTLLRPYLWEAKGALQWLSAIDALVLWACFLYFLAMRGYRQKEVLLHPHLLYPALFGLTLYLFIGYTIPFPGAIVRYKVQAEVFLLIYLSVKSHKKL